MATVEEPMLGLNFLAPTSESHSQKELCFCWGERIFFALQDPSCWTKNQVDIRRINGRKSNIVVYIQGIHTDMEVPKTMKQYHSYMS